MCDKDFVMCDVPRKSIDIIMSAWNDFKRDPSDMEKFKAFDWLINIGVAKWQTYADARKASGA